MIREKLILYLKEYDISRDPCWNPLPANKVESLAFCDLLTSQPLPEFEIDSDGLIYLRWGNLWLIPMGEESIAHFFYKKKYWLCYFNSKEVPRLLHKHLTGKLRPIQPRWRIP